MEANPQRAAAVAPESAVCRDEGRPKWPLAGAPSGLVRLPSTRAQPGRSSQALSTGPRGWKLAKAQQGQAEFQNPLPGPIPACGKSAPPSMRANARMGGPLGLNFFEISRSTPRGSWDCPERLPAVSRLAAAGCPVLDGGLPGHVWRWMGRGARLPNITGSRGGLSPRFGWAVDGCARSAPGRTSWCPGLDGRLRTSCPPWAELPAMDGVNEKVSGWLPREIWLVPGLAGHLYGWFAWNGRCAGGGAMRSAGLGPSRAWRVGRHPPRWAKARGARLERSPGRGPRPTPRQMTP